MRAEHDRGHKGTSTTQEKKYGVGRGCLAETEPVGWEGVLQKMLCFHLCLPGRLWKDLPSFWCFCHKKGSGAGTHLGRPGGSVLLWVYCVVLAS